MPFRLRLPAVALLVVPLLSGCQANLWERPTAVAPAPPAAAPPTIPPPRPLSLIPEPASLVRHDGGFLLTRDSAVVCARGDAACGWIAHYLADLLERTRDLTPELREGDVSAPAPGAVVLRRLAVAGGAEAYRLDVAPQGVVISAATDAGLFYGAVTLWQLASQETGVVGEIAVPAVAIADRPRFAWRGILLDSARHFQSPAFVKAFIDAMALHKLNVLQWHLTDDQGWRLAIRRYPRLTRIGAWRRTASGARYGGFYTQREVRDIVAYAKRRNVTIVPEIEMPGHALAAIVSYPWLGSVRHPPEAVSGDWGVFPYLYNVDESTFRFLDNVLREVMALFPGRTIHIGGDEAVKDEWNASPEIAARMRRLGIKDADALQAYFVDRIGRFLAAHGRHLIGWDEILNRNLAPDAAVTSWRNIASAVEAAKLGHDVVLSPAPMLYFDYCQADRAGEPPCRGMEVTLKDVYGFDPAPPELDMARVIGLQANIWTEHIAADDRVAYAAFPRAAALAELGWTPPAGHDWQSFLERMPAEIDRYRALGLPHSESAFAVDVTAEPAPGGARVTLADQAEFGAIRYTLDGSVPTAASPLYAGPLALPLPAKLSAAAFDDGRALTAPTTAELTRLSILRRSSFAMAQCTSRLPLAVAAAGTVVMVNVMNPCWIYKGLDLSGIAAIDVAVTHVPFNFQIGQDIKKIPLFPDAAPAGQLEIRLDTCDGERLSVVPLTGAGDGLSALHAVLPPHQGIHDLCFRFARRTVDPVWAIDWVQPEE